MAFEGWGRLESIVLAIIGPVTQESLPNNPARVVLPGVVLLPVDVVEVRPHLLTQLHLGRVRQSPELFDQFGELGGVLRHPLWADHEYGDDQEDHELPAVDAEHVHRWTSQLSLIHISEPTRQAEISYAVF